MFLAHFHLALCHLPIFAVPLVLVFLIFARTIEHRTLRQFSLVILAITCLSVIPVYLTGESAEESVEHIKGISHDDIEDHEEAATLGLVILAATGLLSLFALKFGSEERVGKTLDRTLIAAGALGTASLIYVGGLGGKIRHTELEGSPERHEQVPRPPSRLNETTSKPEQAETNEKK